MVQIGIGLSGHNETSSTIQNVLLAEQLGLDFVWVHDIDLEREPFVTSSCIALSTDRIEIGVIANPYTRHPIVSAAAVATLSEIAPGRIRYALGIGGRKSVGHVYCAHDSKPLTRLGAAIELSKKLFKGEKLSLNNELQNAKLAVPIIGEIPIYVAAMVGKRTMRLAGRMADGVLLAGPLGLEFVKCCIDTVTEAATSSGRDPSKIRIAMEMLFSVSEDSHTAKEKVKKNIAEFIITDSRFNSTIIKAGISPEEIEQVRSSFTEGKEQISDTVTSKMVELFSIAGTPQECVRKIRSYARAGVQEICLMTSPDTDLRKVIVLIAEAMLPDLR